MKSCLSRCLEGHNNLLSLRFVAPLEKRRRTPERLVKIQWGHIALKTTLNCDDIPHLDMSALPSIWACRQLTCAQRFTQGNLQCSRISVARSLTHSACVQLYRDLLRLADYVSLQVRPIIFDQCIIPPKHVALRSHYELKHIL